MGSTGRIPCDPEFRIVCLGGSAGALNAYIDILDGVGSNSGMAFVIVSHRSSEHAHLLTEILTSHTEMEVMDALDGTRLRPNCVFIVPPGVEATLRGERFRLTPRDSRGWPTTISAFLESLAENTGRRAIAVILSGRDYDGRSAMATVRSRGGTNMAQADAPSPEMPQAACSTGCVDFYLSAPEIAGQLLGFAR